MVNLITDCYTKCQDGSILRPDDAMLFTALCQFVWIQGEPLPLIFDLEDGVYTKQGITLSALNYLEKIGLIMYAPNGYVKKKFGKHTRLFYHGKPTKIGFQAEAGNQLDLGHVLFTDMGKEQALICAAPRNQVFYEYIIRRWYRQGLVLSSIQIKC